MPTLAKCLDGTPLMHRIDALIRSSLDRYKPRNDWNDLYQDCWLRVLERIDDWKMSSCSVETWVFWLIRGAITSYVSRHTSERKRNWKAGVDRLGREERSVDWFTVYAVRTAMEELSDIQKRVVIAVFWYDKKLPEVARECGICYSTTWFHFQRALKQLRLSLGAWYTGTGCLCTRHRSAPSCHHS